MRNEFQRHKKSDKVKWAFTFIAFVLVFVMIAGLTLQLFGKDKLKPSEWFKKDEIEQELPEDGGEAAPLLDTAHVVTISV